MSPALRLRRLDAISALLERSLIARRELRFEDALDAVLDATPAAAAAAFGPDLGAVPVAERRIQPAYGDPPDGLRRVLAALAERACSTRESVRINDVRRDTDGFPDAISLMALDAHAALALPLSSQSGVEGVLVLLFADAAMLDEETLRYVDSVARTTALALERDRGSEAERSFREELTESGRMATLGLYTTSVAHEIRGPAGALVLQHEELRSLTQQLGVLSGSSDTALGGAVAELGEVVSDMGVAVDRIRDTVSQLTTLGRRESAATRVSLLEVVRESLAIARPHLDRRGVLLEEDLERDCFTLGRRDNLGQIVLNLVFNAADAALANSPPRVWVRVMGGPEHVLLIVEDNGPGIAPESIAHIFKPFYTTKQRGKGTGLGLKIVNDVVSAHGGHIEVDRREGGGACFRVILPRSAPSSLKPVSQSSPMISAVGAQPRRIFVVEDDPVFARTVRRALRPHEVRTAASASEAEIALLDPAYKPELVLCDVFLPGTNGNVLHARLCERRPEVAARFVFVTGGALGKTEADYLRASGCLTLFKPLDVRSLLELLKSESDSPPLAVRTLS